VNRGRIFDRLLTSNAV